MGPIHPDACPACFKSRHRLVYGQAVDKTINGNWVRAVYQCSACQEIWSWEWFTPASPGWDYIE